MKANGISMDINTSATASVTKRRRQPDLMLKISGHFNIEHYRNGVKIDEWTADNAVVNQGKNHALDVLFNGATAHSTWYLGLIDNSGFTALAAADTYANINQVGNGWDEFDDYTDAGNSDSAVTRPDWTQGSAASQAVTNSSVVVYDITGTGTVKGLFAVAGTNAQTKDDHTGSGNLLWCTALFNGGDKSVASSDQLKVTFTVSL